ncbi:uncharacterized protein LOC133545902 [Nerophis ophidion]|uniref:uncharacterized protein LOC133545902 n=1 Tax=Nerophis ophidion TaxID=159077 RepID=UPI002ADF96CA|nr:uncharacterized protein LOC133545902 [Nerophis ophidion]
MRRFLRGPREEDCSQIHYLTAKCSRLAGDKALCERELLVCRAREKKLQKDFQNVAAQLIHLEKTNMELKRTQDHLLGNIRQQQELVDNLRRRLFLLVEESERDEEVARQVTSELLCLQSSEVQLQGLLVELHDQAQRRQTAEEGPAVELHAQAQRRHTAEEGLLVELHAQAQCRHTAEEGPAAELHAQALNADAPTQGLLAELHAQAQRRHTAEEGPAAELHAQAQRRHTAEEGLLVELHAQAQCRHTAEEGPAAELHAQALSADAPTQGLLAELHAQAQRRHTAEEGPAAELHAQALSADAPTQGLLAELQRKSAALEDLQEANKMLEEEVKACGVAHEEQVAALQRQNEGSVKKLQDTVEQLEWLCQQQRYWMDYIKRFKDCLLEERESLLDRVNTLEREAQTWKKKSRHASLHTPPCCPLLDAHSQRTTQTSWDSDEEAELEHQVMRSEVVYEAHQVGLFLGGGGGNQDRGTHVVMEGDKFS